jgi:hypothetical protein
MDSIDEPGIRLSCERPVIGTVLQAVRESSTQAAMINLVNMTVLLKFSF